MPTIKVDNLIITTDNEGAREFSKVSYPLRYGLFAEIKSPEHVFQFNLNGEIKFITGRTEDWPDPMEWLKRTVADDWIYYSTGGYSGVYSSFGEYYLPCLSYPSNSINVSDPFDRDSVRDAINSWRKLYLKISKLHTESLSEEFRNFINSVIKRSPESLKLRAKKLHETIGENITVLPPDTRHVDYDVIPVIIADGCLYRCGFCRIKSKRDFKIRSMENIKRQIKGLKNLFGSDIRNYNSIFLGQHDALHAGRDLIEFAAEYAYNEFGLERSNLKDSNLFLFGSVDSLINAGDDLFECLNSLPYLTYINLGLESADRETLIKLGKSITPEAVDDAFTKLVDINKKYEKIVVTANFLFGDSLPKGHIPSFFRLIEQRLEHHYPKGAIYFSPFLDAKSEEKRGIKRKFYRIKAGSRLPTFLYLIQRL